jgi:hypothetical protein
LPEKRQKKKKKKSKAFSSPLSIRRETHLGLLKHSIDAEKPHKLCSELVVSAVEKKPVEQIAKGASDEERAPRRVSRNHGVHNFLLLLQLALKLRQCSIQRHLYSVLGLVEHVLAKHRKLRRRRRSHIILTKNDEEEKKIAALLQT